MVEGPTLPILVQVARAATQLSADYLFGVFVERGTCPARGLIVVAGHQGRLLKKAAPLLCMWMFLGTALITSGGWRPLLGGLLSQGPWQEPPSVAGRIAAGRSVALRNLCWAQASRESPLYEPVIFAMALE